MKKRFMKAAAISLAAMMFLCACTSTGNSNDNGATGLSTEPIGSSSSEEAAPSANISAYSPITLITRKVTSSYEGKTLCSGSFTEVILSDEYKEKYPKIADYLSNYNETSRYAIPEEISVFANWVLSEPAPGEPDYDGEYFDQVDVEIARIDDKLFSMIEHMNEFTGGVHPNYFSGSINLDPATGESLRLDQVLGDKTLLSNAIRTELEKAYPGIMDEVDSFYYAGEDGDPDQFVQKLNEDSYTWTINGAGLNIIFSPYEIASYAAGELSVTLTPTDYPGLIQDSYILSEPQDLEKMITRADGDPVTVEPKEDEPEPEAISISNPTWKAYKAEGITSGSDHISLTKTKEEKTDYLDTYAWAEENGFNTEMLTHEDENYFYIGSNEIDYANTFQTIQIYDISMETMYYSFDLSELCNGPDYEEEKTSACNQFIRYATIAGNILYAELGHLGYASEEPDSSYIVAIDLDNNELIFKSEPLVANGGNFKIVGDTIICGYGFTAEPDNIYLLDRFTGEKYDSIPINSAADQFQIKGDTLYVATYNTAYEFAISH